MPNNEPPVEVIQGEARAREVLAAQYLADGGTPEIAEAIRQDDQVLIRDDTAIRAMLAFARHPAHVDGEGCIICDGNLPELPHEYPLLAFQSEARAGEGETHPLLVEKLRRQADFNTNDCGCGKCVQCYTTSLMIQVADILATPSHPLPDREAIARAMYEFEPFGDQETDLDGRPTGPGYEIRWDQLPEYSPDAQEEFLKRADAILSLTLTPSPGGEGETWASIAEWCEATFGPCSPERVATRAREEMKELVDETEIAAGWTNKARIEAADVLICLSRVPGIWEAVEEKMAINRARKWRIMGDGTGYHERPGNEPPTP